jgi:hypothetical protein
MGAPGSSDGRFPDTHYPDWLPAYKAAMLELDPAKLQERIYAAQEAINQRLKYLAKDGGGDPKEKQAIADALSGLAILEREAIARRSAGSE